MLDSDFIELNFSQRICHFFCNIQIISKGRLRRSLFQAYFHFSEVIPLKSLMKLCLENKSKTFCQRYEKFVIGISFRKEAQDEDALLFFLKFTPFFRRTKSFEEGQNSKRLKQKKIDSLAPVPPLLVTIHPLLNYVKCRVAI